MFVYIDDSGDERSRCFSALILHESAWKQSQAEIKRFRRSLKASDGMFVTKELHATEFVAGRGRVGTEIVSKGRRCEIFRETLALIASLPNLHLMNAISSRANERVIFERLINRINVAMSQWRSNAIIFHDEGKDYTKLVRRMCVYNPIRSKFGAWPGGSPIKNIPLDRILEDIVYRDSKQSSFIQMADFCAYALFRSEFPLASKTKYGLDQAFSILQPRCVKGAFQKDPRQLGIIRF
ncbi:MAG: DUF3800 domain-containing protein [Acidobacteria bacterium]|nr:DUF3800 domain-containing protein [Acidobacteriota bacterium]